MCSSGAFAERGINGLHGAMCECLVEDPALLMHVPRPVRRRDVFVEPMSVVAKALRHALLNQRRLRWHQWRALMLGAGPIGLLATLTPRSLGWSVTTVARRGHDSLTARIVREVGAVYVSTRETPVAGLPRGGPSHDFIVAATGDVRVAFDCLPMLAVNGALCLKRVTGGTTHASIPVDRINYELVLGNKLIFGTVNANKQDHVDGLEHVEKIEASFPGVLAKLVTGVATFDIASSAFKLQREGIKTIFRVSGDPLP